MRFSAFVLASSALLASPALAQDNPRADRKPMTKPAHVVAKSDQLVTVRNAKGETRSYNCRKPANAKRKACKR